MLLDVESSTTISPPVEATELVSAITLTNPALAAGVLASVITLLFPPLGITNSISTVPTSSVTLTQYETVSPTGIVTLREPPHKSQFPTNGKVILFADKTYSFI